MVLLRKLLSSSDRLHLGGLCCQVAQKNPAEKLKMFSEGLK